MVRSDDDSKKFVLWGLPFQFRHSYVTTVKTGKKRKEGRKELRMPDAKHSDRDYPRKYTVSHYRLGPRLIRTAESKFYEEWYPGKRMHTAPPQTNPATLTIFTLNDACRNHWYYYCYYYYYYYYSRKKWVSKALHYNCYFVLIRFLNISGAFCVLSFIIIILNTGKRFLKNVETLTQKWKGNKTDKVRVT